MSVEPWPFKASREYAKDLMSAGNSGDPKIQNLRAILYNWIMKHRVEQSEFRSFYELIKKSWNGPYFDRELKNKLMSNKDVDSKILDKLTDELYRAVIVKELPLATNCEKKLGSDAYLATYSKLCSEYTKGIKVDNLIEGNTYPDLDKSIEKLSHLFKDYLSKIVKQIPNERQRKAFMRDTKLINGKLKKITNLCVKNTNSFYETLIKRYGAKMKEAAKNDPAAYKKRLRFLKENLDVVGYNLWGYMTKQWMVRELLEYFDNHISKLIWFSDGYIATEQIVRNSKEIDSYIQEKIAVGKKKFVGIRIMSPIDDTTDPEVHNVSNM